MSDRESNPKNSSNFNFLNMGGTNPNERQIAYRCRHFRNDRPCSFHKDEGVHCDSCPHKDLVSQRLLVIKLDSPGDVLRTTCLLPSLKRAYPSSQITWMTRKDSRPLLEHNPAIDLVVDRWEEMFAIVKSEHFDVAINPDANPQAARLLQLVNADEKLGIGWSELGHVLALNPEAERWLQMGLLDDLKRENQETYQTHIHELCRLKLVDPKPLLYLTAQEQRSAGNHLRSLGVDWELPVVGMNSGAGSRWPQKSWTVENQIKLIRLAKRQHPEWQILLLGGPEEAERNRLLEDSCLGLIVNCGQHPVREFAALVGQTHLLLTADTLALHIGLALDRQVVALFGPTSHTEIDLCGLGEKFFANLECLCCYRNECKLLPNCMDLLSPETVLDAIERGLSTVDPP